MRVKTLIKSIVFTLSLGIAFSMICVYPLLSVACAAAPNTHLPIARSATHATQAIDPIAEWNQQAVALSLRPTPALAPVQQTRVMAIFHLAVHDAVNGITGEYETYLTPPSAPENASPVAAAVKPVGLECPHCGAKFEKPLKFCGECGKSMSEGESA